MSTLALWEEAAPLGTPEEMVLLSELQSYTSQLCNYDYEEPNTAKSTSAEIGINMTAPLHKSRVSLEDELLSRRDAIIKLRDELSARLSDIHEADSLLKDSSIGIHGLSLLMTSSCHEKSSAERLAEVRSKLHYYDNLSSIVEYVNIGHFDMGDQFSKNLEATGKAIRYFSKQPPSTEVHLFLNKYVDCLKRLIPSLVEHIKTASNEDDLTRHCRLFSTTLFEVKGFESYLDAVLRVLYERCKGKTEKEQLDYLIMAMPLHFQSESEK